PTSRSATPPTRRSGSRDDAKTGRRAAGIYFHENTLSNLLKCLTWTGQASPIMTALAFFKNLCANMQDLHPHLRQATLLSAPSIEYKGRAFAMIHDDRIVLKLGEDDLPERMAIGWQYYRPYGRPVYLQ